MADKITKLAFEISAIKAQLRARATAPQLGNSSLENRALNQYDGAGNLGAQFGVLPDGTNGAGSFTGPNPPQPSQPSCSTIPGLIEARWNGLFVDALSPLDLRHVAVYVVPDGGTIDLAHAAGTVSGELGDAAAIQMPIGTYQVYFVAWSLSGKWSVPSVPTTVVVPAAVDADSVSTALADLNDKTDGLLTTAGQLGTRLDTAETDLTAHETRIADAETELTDAFGQISTVGTAASSAQTTANTALSDAATAAGIANGKGKVLVQSTAPGAADRNAVTLWIDTTGGANTPKRWTTGTTWVAVTDKAATDAAAAAVVAQSTANSAQTAASNAQTKADTAFADAATAAGIANGKGKVLAQTSAPAAADQNAVTLWIDTTGGNNTPKRWSGSAWVAVTDKAATDAAAAAVAAQNTATAAQTAAGTAQSTADGAMTMAVSKGKVYYSTAAPSGSGTAVGDLWRRRGGTGGQEIIGEWQWTGSTWVAQTVSGSIVSNMDIGFLTAGSAIMSQALINKLVAGTANFQTVDVKNLFVTTGTFAEAVITQLWADIFIAHKITVNELAVGSFDNLISDPLIQDLGEWSGTAPSVQKFLDQGRWGGGSILVATGTGQVGSYYAIGTLAKRTRMEPGRTYRVTIQARGSVDVPVGGVGVYLRLYDAANTGFVFLTPANYNNTAVIPAGTWSTITGTFTIPEDTMYVYGIVGMYKQTAYTTGSVRFSNPNITLMADGVLVVDGSITAASLSADAINGKVITGATFQTSATADLGIKIDNAGFRAYGPNGGNPVTEIRTDGGTVYSVTDPVSGDVLASLGSDGTVSGSRLNIEDDPIFQGNPLLGGTGINSFSTDIGAGILDFFPRGMVARGYRDSRNFTATNKEGEILELSYDNLANRGYRIHITPASAYVRPGVTGVICVYQTRDGSRPTMDSPLIHRIIFRNATTADIIHPFGGSFYDLGTAGKVRYLFTFRGESGQMLFGNFNPGGVFRVWVEDIGYAVVETGINRGGARDLTAPAPPAPPEVEPENYTKTYSPTDHRSYTGGGATYTLSGSEPNKMYQGQSPYGPSGILSSIATFPSMTGDLSGATITSIRAYFYFDFWYYNSGGTADIMLHGQSSTPSTKPSLTNAVNSANWPKPGGRWVTIPSTYWAGFKSGTYRGVGLGDGTSGYTHYGYANWSKTKIEIKYTK